MVHGGGVCACVLRQVFFLEGAVVSLWAITSRGGYAPLARCLTGARLARLGVARLVSSAAAAREAEPARMWARQRADGRRKAAAAAMQGGAIGVW